MTLHPYIGLSELVGYCQLCHEQGDKCRRVSVDVPTLARIRTVARIEIERTQFLGIAFVKKR